MLKTKEIIDGLQGIVNRHALFAIIWHVVFYVLIAALMVQWEPTNRTLAILFCIPLFSVAVFAWLSGNPFNGTLFSILGILILVFGLKASSQPVSISQSSFMIIGIMMIVFGLAYPHFIETRSILRYFYVTPLGLIPCPTLSILIGFILLLNGLGSQSIMLTLAISGLFYGIIGVLKLAVYIDLWLIFGAITILIKYILSL